MAALVSERFSSTGKLKVQHIMNLTCILHACGLLVDNMQIKCREWGYNSLIRLLMKI